MFTKYIIFFYLRYLKWINTPKALIKFAVKRNGNKVIAVEEGNNITLNELNNSVNRICWGLTGLGLKKGDKVAVWIHNSIEFIQIRLACYKCGFVFCALIEDFSVEQALEILQDINCSVLFYDACLDVVKFREQYQKLQIPNYIHIDENVKLTGSLSYKQLINGQSSKEPKIRVKPTEISAIGFTSGTTGKSKGVVWTHKAWLYSFYHFLLNSRDRMSGNKVFLHVVPFSTAGSLVLLPALVNGVKNLFLQRFNAKDVADVIEREKVTHLVLPPSFLIELWDYYVVNQNRYNFTSLQSISVGSAILHSKKWEEMIGTFGPIIQQSYGMAEVLAPLAFLKITDVAGQRRLLKSVGKPIPQVKVKIDTKSINKSGNICISSVTSAAGYWKKDELTRKHFYGNWFKTPDVGYFDEDGYLYINDRKANIYEFEGFQIISRDIEEVIHEFPGIKEVCIACFRSEIIAFISERLNHSMDVDELLKFCKSMIKDARAIPVRFIVLETLPHSTSGKLLKDNLINQILTNDKYTRQSKS
jgi:acyl-coenzyme A synthetase/AMP-(fatty) acid ligase